MTPIMVVRNRGNKAILQKKLIRGEWLTVNCEPLTDFTHISESQLSVCQEEM